MEANEIFSRSGRRYGCCQAARSASEFGRLYKRRCHGLRRSCVAYLDFNLFGVAVAVSPGECFKIVCFAGFEIDGRRENPVVGVIAFAIIIDGAFAGVENPCFTVLVGVKHRMLAEYLFIRHIHLDRSIVMAEVYGV